MPRALILLICLLASPAAFAGRWVEFVVSEHEPNWEVGPVSPLSCWLEQKIPQYGIARFAQQAGRPLTFILEPQRPPDKTGTARLSSVPPAWRHGVLVRDFGSVDYRAEEQAFRLSEAVSQQLLWELEQGMFPAFTYDDWFGGRDTVVVKVSPIAISEPLAQFSRCLGQVVPYAWEDVRRNVFHFDPYVVELDPRQKERLEAVATYVKADPSVVGIEIDAYTDSWGRRYKNMELSEKRAAAVREYLVSLGVSQDMLAAEAHGERDPLTSNRTRQGRDLNRRLTVTLKRQ